MDIKKLLKLAAEHQASDLHIVKGLPPIFRIDGRLMPADEVVDKAELSDAADTGSAAKAAGIKDWGLVAGQTLDLKDYKGQSAVSDEDLEKMVTTLITKDQRARLDEDKDLDFSYAVNNFRFRVNLSYEKENLKLVARIISDQKPTLEELGLPPIVTELLNMHQGLIILTGPTGSGKSTTLAAMINYLNNNFSYNIVTFEDPIEFLFDPNKSIITQRQLGFDMPTFASGLKHVLRQDPNVIMVGEMRDLETISTAITLAETGHLVLATLHTYSASQTVDRIIDIFPPYQQSQIKSELSMILAAVISQRLLPKVGGGRVAVREILIRNTAVANLIREQKIAQIRNVIETSYKEGMMTFERSIKELYAAGQISKEVAEEQLNDPTISS